MHVRRGIRLVIASVAAVVLGGSARAIDVVIDYRYDVNGFFSTATENGQKARATVEAAAAFFSNLIDDSLAAISWTDPTTPGPSNTPVWRQVITHPGTGANNYAISAAANAAQDGLTATQGAASEFRDIAISANQFLVYVGGTSLPTTAIGGTGVAYFGSQAFNDSISRRGKPSGEYAYWGGYVAFDNDAGANWMYDYTQPITSGKTDLYSVALHEIGHTLGLNGNSSEWNALQVGAEWRGPAALAAWKAEDPTAPAAATGIPTASTVDHHWLDHPVGQFFLPAVQSYILGTRILQETAMDPSITVGTRKLFTNVDAYALRDLGWSIPDAAFDVETLPADFNSDGYVNAADELIWRTAFATGTAGADADFDGDSDGADLIIWQKQLGMNSVMPTALAGAGAIPEPAGAMLAALGAGALAMRRRARRPGKRHRDDAG